MRRVIYTLCILLSSFRLFSQQDSVVVDISTPYKSIQTFLYHLDPDHRNDSIAAQPFEPQRRGLAYAKIIATKLKQVLDGTGHYIYTDEIPKQANYYDSVTNKHKYVLTEDFPEIYLLRRQSSRDWVFADASIAAIEEAHSNTFRFGTGALLEWLPRMGERKVLGLYMFQIMAIFILAVLSTIIHRIFTFFSERVIRKLLIETGFSETSHELLLPIARPTSVFIIILLLTIFIPVLQLPPSYSQYVILILRVLLPLLGTIIVYRFVNVGARYLSKLALKTESTLDDQMVPLLRKALKTFVVLTGTLFILDNLNVPILPLLTGLSIGGLAFALAAQDTIKNFFGSLMIFIDKPFQIGDWVTSGDIDGTVEEVGFRSSRIRTFRNSLMYVPNGKLADSNIDNHGLRKFRRFMTRIGVTYNTTPATMEAFVTGLRKIVDTHPHTNKENYHIYFNDLGTSSLEILFYIFFEVPTWGDELKCRHEVLLEIMKLGEKLGVHFAYPTQTVHIENFPGKPSLSPKFLSKEDMDKALEEHFSPK